VAAVSAVSVFLVEYAQSGPGNDSHTTLRAVCSSYERALEFARKESTPELKDVAARNGWKSAHIIREATLDTGALGWVWYVDLDGEVHNEWPF
jgi:hypothetical protein